MPMRIGRNLLQVLFSKEELARSVVIKSVKSKKPALDQERIQRKRRNIKRNMVDG